MAAGSPQGSDLKEKERKKKEKGERDRNGERERDRERERERDRERDRVREKAQDESLSFLYRGLGSDIPSLLRDNIVHTDRPWCNVGGSISGCEHRCGAHGCWAAQHVCEPKLTGYPVAFSL